MASLLFLGYEFLAALAPLCLIYLIRHGLDRSFGWLLIFGIYLMLVFNVTGAGTLYDISMYGFQWRGEQVNFIPSEGEASLINNLLNVVMLMPFGFVAASFFQGKAKTTKVISSGFSLILLIELSQLLNNRRTDIDDVIMNGAGLIIGLIIWKICSLINSRLSLFNIKSPIKFQVITVVLIVFLSRFFLLNDYGLAKIIYNF